MKDSCAPLAPELFHSGSIAFPVVLSGLGRQDRQSVALREPPARYFVHPVNGDGELSSVRALYQAFFLQIPKMKLDQLLRAPEKVFQDDASNPRTRYVPLAGRIKYRKDSLPQPQVRIEAVGRLCGLIENLPPAGLPSFISGIIGGALLRVAQNTIGFHDAPESAFITRQHIVGVVSFRKQSEYAFDCFEICVAAYLEEFVIIIFSIVTHFVAPVY